MTNPAQMNFWQERYQAQQTDWDMGQPAPPFVDYLNEPNALPPGRLVVPGCGRGHDALYFAQQGFQVVGVDFAPAAIAYCQQQAARLDVQAQAHFEVRDIFDLLPQYHEQFDYALEYTCFCAIPVQRRPEYVQLIRGLLRPGGWLIATFFTHGQPGGPPFDTNPAELHQLFEPYFEFERLEPAQRSAKPRQNEETFGLLRKK